MCNPIPTWQSFDAVPPGYPQFNYLFDNDVEPEWTRVRLSDALNEGRKMAVRFFWLSGELNNGGLDQYFYNSSGDFAVDQIADLRMIGCADSADILVAASRKLFGVDSPPTGAARDSAFFKQTEKLLAETRQLYDKEIGIAVALCAWFRRNPHYFSHLK